MLKIAICDDNNTELLHMKQILEEFKASHIQNYHIQYDAFTSGLDLLMAAKDSTSYDIYILDIVMPLMTGMEVASEIRMKNSLAKILFLTSSREFAVDSYKVDAFYYLLKPIHKETLIPILEKACTDLSIQKEKGIIVKCKTGLTKVYLYNLEYVEVIGRTLCFHLTNGEVLESLGTMSELEQDLLRDKRFIKSHRAFIVNMDCLHHLTDRDITTFSHNVVPLSRKLSKNIKQAYIDYTFD